MKKSIVLSAGSAVAASALMALFGTGVAAADDYAGQTYADASSAASDAGQTVIVAGRVGDKVAQDDCIVDAVADARPSPVRGRLRARRGQVQFNLNCNGGYATAEHAAGPRWPARRAGRPRPPRTRPLPKSSRRSKRSALPDQ